MKTISVDWADATAEQVSSGVFGSLVFEVSVPLVFIRAHLRSGRFWSDSALLKLGRFSDAFIAFDDGQVHATIRVSFERDGAFLCIEALSMAVRAIRIEHMSDHSRRWGVLLGTVSGLQWLLSGFLERKLLDLVSAAVVEQNQRVQLVAWQDISAVSDLKKKMGAWQATAAARERLEYIAVSKLQQAWRRRPPGLSQRLRALRSSTASSVASATAASGRVSGRASPEPLPWHNVSSSQRERRTGEARAETRPDSRAPSPRSTI